MLKVFTLTFMFFLLCDMLWLGLIAKKMYAEAYGSMLRLDAQGNLNPNYWAALLVYVALVIGVVVFPAAKAGNSPMMGLIWGALFGLITYGVYDGTNYAVMDQWPGYIAIIDTLWGTCLCSACSCVAVCIKSYL